LFAAHEFAADPDSRSAELQEHQLRVTVPEPLQVIELVQAQLHYFESL